MSKSAEDKSPATVLTPIVILVLGIIFFKTCVFTDRKEEYSTSSSTSSSVENSDQMGEYQVLAKDAMKGILKDPDSAQYEEVKGYELSSGNYVFCGKVNAKNAYGALTGYERFVAGPGVATLESGASDFTTIWSEMCSGEGRAAWF